MSFGGLGAAAGGLAGGLQAGQSFQDQAITIKQHQMALDDAKRQLLARAAMFNGMGQQGPQGGPQQGGMPGGQMGGQPMPGAPMPAQPPQQGPMPTMAPGQASMPSPQGGAMQPSPMPQGGQAGPMPGGQQPPQGGPPPGQGGGAPMPGQPDPSQFDPFSAVMRIAADIKRRNPNLDSLTLADAVDGTVKTMQGVQPDMRAQMSYLANLYRTQAQEQIAGGHDATRIATNANTVQGAERNTDVRTGAARDIAAGHDATAIADTQARIQDADRRVTMTQQAITDRFNKGLINKNIAKAQRDVLGAANLQYKTAKDRYNALAANQRAGTPVDPQQMQAATDALGFATKRLKEVADKIATDSAKPAGGDSIDAKIANAPTDKDAIAIADAASSEPPPELKAIDPKARKLADGTTTKEFPGWVVRAGKWVKK